MNALPQGNPKLVKHSLVLRNKILRIFHVEAEETGKEVVVIVTAIEEGEEMKNVIEKTKGRIVEEVQ